MRSAVNRPQRGEPENLRWPPRMCEIAPGSTQQANTVYTEKLVSTRFVLGAGDDIELA